MWLKKSSSFIIQCTCHGSMIVKSCADVVFNVQGVRPLALVSTEYLPNPFPVLPTWLSAIDKSVHYFETSQSFHLVRGVDYVWVESFPLPPDLLQSGFPFGPFRFIRYWYEESIWWLVLKDKTTECFLIEREKTISWFTSISDDLLCKC